MIQIKWFARGGQGGFTACRLMALAAAEESGSYVQAFPSFGPERIRVARLLDNMTGGTALAESMHGAGSPQAMRVTIRRQVDWEEKKNMARKLAGVKPHKEE